MTACRFQRTKFCLYTGVLAVVMSLGCPATMAEQLKAKPVRAGSDNDVIGRTCSLDGGSLLTVVERNHDWSSGNLYAFRSFDGGETWGSAIPVDTGVGNQSTFAILEGGLDTVCVYYASNHAGTYRIQETSSRRGTHWTASRTVAASEHWGEDVYDPSAALAPDGSLAMAFARRGGGVYLARRDKKQWDTAAILIQDQAFRPRLCLHPDGTYILCYQRRFQGLEDVRMRTSRNLLTWTEEVDVNPFSISHDPFCAVCPDGSLLLVYAAWVENRFALYVQRGNPGASWSEAVPLSSDSAFDTQPSVFIEGGSAHFTWTRAVDYDTDNDILYGAIALDRMTLASPAPRYDSKRVWSLSAGQDPWASAFDLLGRATPVPPSPRAPSRPFGPVLLVRCKAGWCQVH